MSLEAAKKFLTEVNAEEFTGKSTEELAAYLKENGYDCTPEEVKKACILAASLSEEELEKVTGGNNGNGCPHAAKKGKQGELGSAGGNGNCGFDYYEGPCSATVEKGSWCWSNDYCTWVEVTYHADCLSDIGYTPDYDYCTMPA